MSRHGNFLPHGNAERCEVTTEEIYIGFLCNVSHRVNIKKTEIHIYPLQDVEGYFSYLNYNIIKTKQGEKQ